MKTAEEYIRELEGQSEDTILYVGFKDTTIAVASTDPQRLRLLQEAMTNGGMPFAFARIVPGAVEMGLLPEYEGDEHLLGVLEQLRAEGERLVRQAGAK